MADNVIPFPVPLPEPTPEQFAKIFALADEEWERREEEALRAANAAHASRLPLRVVPPVA
jgi:hypothetical protein